MHWDVVQDIDCRSKSAFKNVKKSSRCGTDVWRSDTCGRPFFLCFTNTVDVSGQRPLLDEAEHSTYFGKYIQIINTQTVQSENFSKQHC